MMTEHRGLSVYVHENGKINMYKPTIQQSTSQQPVLKHRGKYYPLVDWKFLSYTGKTINLSNKNSVYANEHNTILRSEINK